MRKKVLWFAAGVSVGAAVGLLIAPVPGASARRYLAERTDGGRQLLAASGKDFIERTRELYERGCQLADEAADMFDEGRRIAGG